MKPRVLVAVDRSETSTRVVEYVGEILRGCVGIEITLYHVFEIPPMFLEFTREWWHDVHEGRQQWEREKREQIDTEIFAPARAILKDKGIREDAIQVRTKLAEDAHPDVALAIMNEVKTGGYGTVALGRRGVTMLSEFMFGSVASKVVHHIRDCTIWIVE